MIRLLQSRAGWLTASVLLYLAGALPVFADGEFLLQPHDTVGIVAGADPRTSLFSAYLETFVVSRFPSADIRFAQLPGIPEQLPSVLVYSPPCYPADPGGLENYADNLAQLARRASQASPSVKITLLEPSACAQRGPVLQTLEKKLSEAGTRDQIILLAGVTATDPDPGTQLSVAQAILDQWKAPTIVFDTSVDVLGKRFLDSVNSYPHDLEADRVIGWRQEETTLPVNFAASIGDPQDPRLAEFNDRFNRQIVRLRGARPEKFRVTVDGWTATTRWGNDLFEGINLAAYRTPMSHLATRVHELTLELLGLQLASWTSGADVAALAARAEEVQTERAEIVARPVAHDYEFLPDAR